FIEQENFLLPHLVYLGADDFSDSVAVFFSENVFLQIADSAGKGLLGCENRAATKIIQVYFLVKLFTHFEVGFYFNCIRIGYLGQWVFYLAIFHNHAATNDLKVAFLGVYDDI